MLSHNWMHGDGVACISERARGAWSSTRGDVCSPVAVRQIVGEHVIMFTDACSTELDKHYDKSKAAMVAILLKKTGKSSGTGITSEGILEPFSKGSDLNRLHFDYNWVQTQKEGQCCLLPFNTNVAYHEVSQEHLSRLEQFDQRGERAKR